MWVNVGNWGSYNPIIASYVSWSQSETNPTWVPNPRLINGTQIQAQLRQGQLAMEPGSWISVASPWKIPRVPQCPTDSRHILLLLVFHYMYTLRFYLTWLAGKSTMNEHVFPIENRESSNVTFVFWGVIVGSENTFLFLATNLMFV